VTDAAKTSPTGPMSAIAALSGRSLTDLYRLFRMEGSPSPVAHVAGVPVYDLDRAMTWLHPESGADAGLLARDAVVKLQPPSV
jgi:hypothetical protein